MRSNRHVLVIVGLLVALAACNYKGPSLAGYEGLQFKVVSYYDRFATEESGQCRAPRMSPSATEVLEDTPERLVVAVRYSYVDRVFGDTDNNGLGINIFRCRGFATRNFTIAKGPEDSLTVVDMSGPKRNPKNFAGQPSRKA